MKIKMWLMGFAVAAGLVIFLPVGILLLISFVLYFLSDQFKPAEIVENKDYKQNEYADHFKIFAGDQYKKNQYSDQVKEANV